MHERLTASSAVKCEYWIVSQTDSDNLLNYFLLTILNFSFIIRECVTLDGPDFEISS